MRKWNFCAGPAAIPEEVLIEAQNELLEWGLSGSSVMEVSHRSDLFAEVAASSSKDIKALLNIAEWFKEEKPMLDQLEDHDQIMDDQLVNPDDDKATELGEVPHEEEKGSILQKNLFAPYLYGRYTY